MIIDENNVRKMPLDKRLELCTFVIKNDQDESKRWDAVWLAGEIAEITGPTKSIFEQIADLMEWILENDNNGVVKHEACFQIAARNMRNKIPALINSAFSDQSGLVKHEALESLGLMRAFEVEDSIKKALDDLNPDVSETARFVLKRLERMRHISTEYVPSNIL